MKQMLMEWVLTSALLILAVIVLRALLGRRISAGLRYALWAVVLVRLLVPLQFFSLPVPAALPDADREPITTNAVPAATVPAIQGEPVGAPVIAVPHPGGVAANDDVTDTPSTAIPDATHLWDVLSWLWLTGTVVVTAAFLFSNLTFALRLRRVRIPLEGTDCPLPVYLAKNLPSPCLFGLVRPSVYVTAESTQDPVMLRHILTHEYTHFRHGDHVWNLFRSAALAVHWWNPLVWLAVILNRRDCELACDEGTLKRLGDDERIAYGRTLLALITVMPRPGDLFRCATTMTGGQKSVFDRVTRIARAPKRWLWAAVVVVIATALACVCAFGQAAGPEPVDTPDLTADLTFALDLALNNEGFFVRIEGSVDGIDLDAGWVAPSWFESYFDDFGYPLGRLRFEIPLCGKSCQLEAVWTDESRTAVRVTATPIVKTGRYLPVGNLLFTVDLTEGTLLELEGYVPKLSPNDPELVPTEAEAVRTARIAAKLLMGAEDYYQSHAGELSVSIDEIPTADPVPEDGTLPFDVPMKMQFASGAGGWDTVITLHPDGSFEGDYHDMDMGDTGPGYRSTEYVCRFHGRFGNIRQVTGASWSLTLEELTLDTGHPIGEEWIEANPANRNYKLRYISSAPYGFSKRDGEGMSVPLEPGAQFMFYTPEASGYRPTDELYGFNSANEDYDSIMYQFWHWMPSSHRIGAWGRNTKLGCYALCNMETGYGFFGIK